MADGVGLFPLLIGQIVIRRNCQIFRSALTNAFPTQASAWGVAQQALMDAVTRPRSTPG
jgi:hypothetical protein